MKGSVYSFSMVILLVFLDVNSIFAQKRQQIILKENWLVKEIQPNEKLPELILSDFSKTGAEWYAASMPKQVQEMYFAIIISTLFRENAE